MRSKASVDRPDGRSPINIEYDGSHEGPAVTRNRALMRVDTEWTTTLDDDDGFYPLHLEALLAHAESTDADMVYSGYEANGHRQYPQPFDLVRLRTGNYNADAALFRTEPAHAAGGCPTGDATSRTAPQPR